MNPLVRYFSIPLAAGLLAAPLPAVAAPHAGDAAPPFSLAKAKGGTVGLGNFKGKPLYINFFASWCSPCNEEAPSIARLYSGYHRRGLAILGIDELEDAGTASGFQRKYNWPFAVGVDDNGTMAHAYGAIALPVHVFIDKRGNVSTYRLGEMEPAEIEDAIKKIL